jgi:CBS domain-containing protein
MFHPDTDVAVELLDRATEALTHAKYSGKNWVVQVGQFDQALAGWRKELNSGNPFASVSARDIMQPFSYLLQSGLDFDRVAPRLLTSGLEYFAVVDKNRSLVGVIGRDQLPQSGPSPADPPPTATGPPLIAPQTVAEEAPFSEVVERFSTEDLPLLVVVRNKEPRGYISREGFLNLIEPIHTSTFRPTWPFSQGTDYLIVPEIVKLEEAGV